MTESASITTCGELYETCATEWWFDRYAPIHPRIATYLPCLRESGHEGQHAFPMLAGGWKLWPETETEDD